MVGEYVLRAHLKLTLVDFISQAFDLGLNCDSSKWKMHGYDLFSPEENQIRLQIWWACCFTDWYV